MKPSSFISLPCIYSNHGFSPTTDFVMVFGFDFLNVFLASRKPKAEEVRPLIYCTTGWIYLHEKLYTIRTKQNENL